MSETVQLVKAYYGKTLQSSRDLQTDACCTTEAMTPEIGQILRKIHPEITNRYYGCGLVIPELLAGARVLDLGSGAGQDCFVLSALVGDSGSVVGVDMTDSQIEIANEFVDHHRQVFGYARSNVEFRLGYLERLDELGLEENSFDVIVSNCVINLCDDKFAVLKSAYQLLKPGGELYFSDVYSDRRIPTHLRQDPVLLGECLSGALYLPDFFHLAASSGFVDVRCVGGRRLNINNAQVRQRLAPAEFSSITFRLFKADGLEPGAEDYGQAVIYRGTIPARANGFDLDQAHRFPTGKVTPVSGNTYKILAASRFASHFTFVGQGETHFGGFGSAENVPGAFTLGIPSKRSTATDATADAASTSSSGCC